MAPARPAGLDMKQHGMTPDGSSSCPHAANPLERTGLSVLNRNKDGNNNDSHNETSSNTHKNIISNNTYNKDTNGNNNSTDTRNINWHRLCGSESTGHPTPRQYDLMAARFTSWQSSCAR